MLLFLDTETTGLYHYDKRSNDPLQPKIVEIAALLCDERGDEWGSFNILINHDIDIPVEASNVHGIMREDCERYGFHESHAIDFLLMLSINVQKIVGHNISFDMKIIRSMMGKEIYESNGYHNIPNYCTMLKSTNICQIPKNNGHKGNKWPTLEEAYRYFFSKEMTGAHRAMTDVMACKELYFKLKELGL